MKGACKECGGRALCIISLQDGYAQTKLLQLSGDSVHRLTIDAGCHFRIRIPAADEYRRNTLEPRIISSGDAGASQSTSQFRKLYYASTQITAWWHFKRKVRLPRTMSRSRYRKSRLRSILIIMPSSYISIERNISSYDLTSRKRE